MNDESLISGWWVFAGVLLLVTGVLNIIYGIASIGDSKFFTEGGGLRPTAGSTPGAGSF